MFSNRKTKELIGKSIDLDEPLPQWLESQMVRDTELAEFYDSSIRLSNDLRDSAAHWVRIRELRSSRNSGSVQPVLTEQKASTRRHQRLFLLASAAVFLLAMGGVFYSYLNLTNHWNRTVNLPSADSRETRSVPLSNDVLLAQADAVRSSLPIADVEPTRSHQASEEQFKKYFYVTVECSVRTFQSMGGTLSEKAVCYPLQSAIRAHESSISQSISARTHDLQPNVNSMRKSLQESQIKLINELIQTTDFLVDTLPEEVTRSWVELSIASNDSL